MLFEGLKLQTYTISTAMLTGILYLPFLNLQISPAYHPATLLLLASSGYLIKLSIRFVQARKLFFIGIIINPLFNFSRIVETFLSKEGFDITNPIIYDTLQFVHTNLDGIIYRLNLTLQ